VKKEKPEDQGIINKTMPIGMKIVVIGGTGLIGTKLVNKLRQHGHKVVAASPSSGVNTVTAKDWQKC
jgi:glutamate dehydrogenase/leucine dehydrogenase